MGHKQSKAKREGSSNSISSNGSVDGHGGEHKLKKKSQFKRRLTKAFSRKSTNRHKEDEQLDNTYASSIQTTMKRTNTTGSLHPPANITLSSTPTKSPLHSQSITGLSISPRGNVVGIPPLQRSETLSSPHVSNTATLESNRTPDGGIPDGADFLPTEDQSKTPKVKRANTTSSFLKYETGGRNVALPKRMSKAYAFHQQIAAKEISQRGAELQKIIESEKPICDVYEDNPFKKGFCRLCKHPKSVHRDPYSDILDDLEEYY